MKFLKVLVGLLVFTSSAFAQDTLWTKAYGGTKYDGGYSVQECSSGGFIIAGETKSFGDTLGDVYLIRTDSLGNTLWTKTYGGDSTDVSHSVQECSSGGFIIAGETKSFGAGGDDVYLIRTGSLGDTLWTKTYGGTNDDIGKSVQECSDGGFIIAGETKSYGAGNDDVYLIRTDSLGDTLWTKTYGGTNDDNGKSVQECSDGGFIIAGMTGSFGAGSDDVYLIRTDALGDTLWTKTYGGPGYDWGESVQECSSGGFIISGETEVATGNGYDVYLIRTDANGNTLWTRHYGGTGYDWGVSVQECASDGFIIAGGTNSFGAGSGDVYLIRTDANGDTLWTKTYGGTDDDWGNSVQECSSGGFIIAGETKSFGAGNTDVYLIRTKLVVELVSPNGGENWIGGSTQNISWSCEDTAKVNHYRLLLSTDGGTTYYDTIVHNIPNTDTSYSWTLPSIISTTCRVKVQILDALDNLISEDVSDSNFSIQTYPTVTSPNGGEVWFADSTYQIEWTTVGQGFGSYRLLYSTDGGSSYSDTIASGILPDSTSWDWTLPSINSTTCRVKVQILDSLNNLISEDESDSNFTIGEAGVEEATNGIPKIFAISQNPNPFMRYAVIKYQLPVKSRVSLRIYDLTGRMIKTLVDGEKKAGYYSIRWDASGIKSGVYFIKFKTDNYEATRKIVLMK